MKKSIAYTKGHACKQACAKRALVININGNINQKIVIIGLGICLSFCNLVILITNVHILFFKWNQIFTLICDFLINSFAMEAAGGTFVMLIERIHAFMKVGFYDEAKINYLYIIIFFILLPIDTIILLPFCDVFVHEIVTTLYWLGCTTSAAICLTIICWICYKRLKIEKLLKNNLNKRYLLIEEQANIKLYLCFIIIHCITSYISYGLYVLQRFKIIKKGIIRVIINCLLCTFYVLYVLCINMLKPSVRRRIEEFLNRYILRKKNISPILMSKKDRDYNETLEHFNQLKLLWI
ncbi:Hypothetical protein SRAE_0000012500 [Strongyloides ratti]|uniref:7TM GPCR, serpentine receptor class e (Sre) family-containing protein n=1 Tax=Strongyloides ratti TaxID=34506 RepID=A0A090MRW7_STRRB|nr:Hypothetical protein SRAE_0000012500 [Strongyloides ratti]CEF60993.1 Hypothetical protein SRAE_0000012500 [Strongyloides ratti]